MKGTIVFSLSIFILALFVKPLALFAQVKKGTNYYYNNFDGGQLGDNISKTSTDKSIDPSNISPLAGSYSLSSIGNGKVGNYQFSFIDNGLSMNKEVERNGWEWTMLYRNSGVNPDDPTNIDANENAWRYWLYANNTTPSDMQGYYITQKGSSIVISQRENSTTTRDFVSYDLSQLGGNNNTYVIRVQRFDKNNYAFRLFIDIYTPSKKEATTLRGESNSGDIGTYSRYNYSGLQVSSTLDGRFKFDEFKLYSRKLEVSTISDPANGFSSALYNGQKNAVIYALKFKTRGLFSEIFQIQTEIEQAGHYSFADIVENPRLFRSVDDYFGNEDDTPIDKNQWGGAFAPSLNYRALDAVDFATQIFQSVGTPDGYLADAGCLFFKVDIKADASDKGTFSIKKLTRMGNYTDNVNVVTQPGVVQGSTSTTPSTAGKVYDWLGGNSTWSALTNWKLSNNTDPTVVPGVNDLVRIGVEKGFSQNPSISTDVKIGSLTIGGNNGTNPTLTIASGNTLTVVNSFNNERASKVSGSGNLAIEGSWSTSIGKIDLLSGSVNVKFTSTKAQKIKDNGSDNGKGVVFGNVYFSGGGTKTLGGTGKFSVAVGKYLTMEANTTLDAAGLLVLKSDSLGSASVNPIPATASIRGQVTVERYIQGGSKDMWRTNRLLSSPVYDNASTFTNADVVGGRQYSFTQFIDDMLITGEGGKDNGFDVNTNNDASAWTYIGSFSALKNINTSLNVGRGAFIYYRGGRANAAKKLAAPYLDADSIVMTFKGVLNQQNVTVPLKGNHLLGNPYAATIDWAAVTKTANISTVIRVWNPKNRQYGIYNGQHGINDGGPYIGPGQAFFVQTTSANVEGTVTFTEAAKVANAGPTPLYNTIMSVNEKSVNNQIMGASDNITYDDASTIRVFLTRDNTENSDETLVVLKRNELATVAGYDVARSGGEEVFLSSLSSDGKKMAINYMPDVATLSSVKLNVEVNNSGAYKMQFSVESIPFGYQAKLRDNYLKTTTDLSMQGTTYAFVVDKSVPASLGNARFELQFSPITTLPVVLTDFNGTKASNGVSLNWKTSSEINNSYFEIHRAGENQVYSFLGKVAANTLGVYQLLDSAPLNGNNYYKLVQVDKGGKSTELPKVVAVNYELTGGAANGLILYPTQVVSTFTLKYKGALTADKYLIKVTDALGGEIYTKEVDKQTVLNGYAGELSAAPTGLYFATLLDAVEGKKIGATKLMKR